MSERLERHIGFLKNVKKAKPAARKQLVARASGDQIKCIADCCHNILTSNIPLSPGQKKKLQRHANIIRLVARKKVSLKNKKRALQQQGGFLPALIAPILGVVGSLIGGLINK